jgi:hypothetical protein
MFCQKFAVSIHSLGDFFIYEKEKFRFEHKISARTENYRRQKADMKPVAKGGSTSSGVTLHVYSPRRPGFRDLCPPGLITTYGN